LKKYWLTKQANDSWFFSHGTVVEKLTSLLVRQYALRNQSSFVSCIGHIHSYINFNLKCAPTLTPNSGTWKLKQFRKNKFVSKNEPKRFRVKTDAIIQIDLPPCCLSKKLPYWIWIRSNRFQSDTHMWKTIIEHLFMKIHNFRAVMLQPHYSGDVTCRLECFCILYNYIQIYRAGRFGQRNALLASPLIWYLCLDFRLFSFYSCFSAVVPLSSCDECHGHKHLPPCKCAIRSGCPHLKIAEFLFNNLTSLKSSHKALNIL